ncbi:MAG: hypothetical protein ACFE0O_08615 [Opitutales bacterium]
MFGLTGRLRGPGRLLLCGLLLASGLLARDVDVRTASGRYFDAVAVDLGSARVAVRLGDLMAERASAWLPVPARFPRPVLVQLIPPEHRATPATARLFVGEQSQVTVAVRWASDTTEAELSAALGRALLTRLSLWHGGDPARPVPVWLEALLWARYRAENHPALREVWAARYPSLDQPSLERLLDPAAPGLSEAEVVHHAWLLGGLIDRAVPSRPTRRELFRRCLIGESGVLRLRQALRLEDPDALSLWWRARGAALAQRLGGALESPGRSRERIGGLLLLTVWDSGDSGRWSTWPDLGARGMEDPALRELADRRLSAVKRAFIQVNPLYHNALHALGRILEARVNGDEQALVDALADWERDWQAAREDERTVMDAVRLR